MNFLGQTDLSRIENKFKRTINLNYGEAYKINGVDVLSGTAVSISNINIDDNDATALQILEGSNAYLTCDTTNGAEKVTIHKDLDVLGAVTSIQTTDLKISDNQIMISSGNAADLVDSGIYTTYNEGGGALYSGIGRLNGEDSKWTVFKSTTEPSGNDITVDSYGDMKIKDLYATAIKPAIDSRYGIDWYNAVNDRFGVEQVNAAISANAMDELRFHTSSLTSGGFSFGKYTALDTWAEFIHINEDGTLKLLTINVDYIYEKTTDNGVVIDGVTMKDNEIYRSGNNISSYCNASLMGSSSAYTFPEGDATNNFYVNNSMNVNYESSGCQYRDGGAGSFSAVSDQGGGVIRFASTAANPIGAVVRITDTTSYNGDYIVVATDLGVSFDVTKAFVATETGNYIRPNQILVSNPGYYNVQISLSASSAGGAASQYRVGVYKDTTEVTHFHAERSHPNGSTDLGSYSCCGILDMIPENSTISLFANRVTSSQDLTIQDFMISIIKVGET